MKLKNFIFRKINLLYFLILFLLGTSTLVTLYSYINTRESFEFFLRELPSLIVETDKNVTKIEEAYTQTEIKAVKDSSYYLIIDENLKGNECKAIPIPDIINKVGQTLNVPDDSTPNFSCDLVSTTTVSGVTDFIYVSKDKFESYETDKNYYLITVKDIKTYKKLLKKYDLTYTFRFIGFNIYDQEINVNREFYSLISKVLMILALIVVIFMNTRGYILSNTKKSRSKKKVESPTKNIVITTLLVTVVPLVLSYVFVETFLLGIIQL